MSLPINFKEKKATNCIMCGYRLPKIEGVYYSINRLCKGCAKTVYVIWRDLHEPKEVRKNEKKQIRRKPTNID